MRDCVLLQVMDKSLRIPGSDQERDLYEWPSDIVRGFRADGTALQDPDDVLACRWRVDGSSMQDLGDVSRWVDEWFVMVNKQCFALRIECLDAKAQVFLLCAFASVCRL